MRIALIGAVAASRVALERLHHPRVELRVFSLDPARASRHSDYCDLAPLAAAKGLTAVPISDPNAPAVLADLRAFTPDIIAVFGWSQLVGKELRAIPRIGVLGWHPSALPRNRGRAVLAWTILQGAAETGFTIFWIDEGMDSGDIAVQIPFAVAADETATTLYRKVVDAAGAAVDALLPKLLAGEIPRHPQDHNKATLCAKRGPEDGRIDWTRPQQEIWTLIRASTHPYPGAFCDRGDGRLTIWAAEKSDDVSSVGVPGEVQTVTSRGALVRCGDGRSLLLINVEREVGRPEPASRVLKLGEHLGRSLERLPLSTAQ